MALGIAEIFAHGAGGEGSEVLHRCRLGGRGGYYDGVIHCAGVSENFDYLRDGGALLADGAVDTDQLAALLIDDGVENDGGLAGLTIADDQLALAAADGNHRIDGLDAGLQRLADRLAVDYAWREALDGIALLGHDGALAIERFA